jgi:hypothetical protein
MSHCGALPALLAAILSNCSAETPDNGPSDVAGGAGGVSEPPATPDAGGGGREAEPFTPPAGGQAPTDQGGAGSERPEAGAGPSPQAGSSSGGADPGVADGGASGGEHPLEGGGGSGGENERAELGSSCETNEDCSTGFCVDGVCCESICSSVCSECDSRGRCVASETDSSCPETDACPDDTACRDFEQGTPYQCASMGTCSAELECLYNDAVLGTPCGSEFQACDGAGRCTMIRQGGDCTSDSVCADGVCVQGRCGAPVISCSDIETAGTSAIEARGLLLNTWPPIQVNGNAVLLGGHFSVSSKVCLDGEELEVLYSDGSNAMIAVPAEANIGTHSLHVLDGAGWVSEQRQLEVTQFESSFPTVEYDNVIYETFKGPDDIVIPEFLPTYPPVINGWLIWNSDSIVQLSGTANGFSGILDVAVPGNAGHFEGTYDIDNHRILATLTTNCNDVPCQTWNYVGFFFCPPGGREYERRTDSVVIDLCSPDMTYPVDFGGFPRRLMFFPASTAGPQVIMSVGN